MRNVVTNCTNDGWKLNLTTGNGTLSLEVLEESTVHFRFHFYGEADYMSNIGLTGCPWGDLTPGKPLPLDVTEKQDAVEVRSGGFLISVRLEELSLRITDEEGWALLQDIAPLSYRKDGNCRRSHVAVMRPDSVCLGFGERSGRLNKYGRHLKLRNLDAWGYNAENTDPLYASIPFFIRLDPTTNKACGVFYCNTNPGVLDMGEERCTYYGDYYRYEVDDGDIDCYLFAGPAIRDILRHYTALTGRTPMPPDYSLGNIGSAMYFAETDERSDLEEYKYLDRFKEHDIPCDFMYLSSGYFSDAEGRRIAFEWNRKRFPDPAAFVNEARKRQVPICANVKPGILTIHPRFMEFSEKGCLVKNREGLPATTKYWGGQAVYLDLMTETGRSAWRNMLEEQLIRNGILDIWNDNCEFEMEEPNAVCGEAGSIQHEAVRSLLPNILARLAREVVATVDPNHRPYVVNRSGGFGIQRFAQVWSGDNVGDWRTLQYNIPMMLGFGLSGVANNACDIGGFAGNMPSEELLVRWVQNGIFQPRFCIHCSKQDNSVTEPWMYKSVLPIIRETIRLRYRLLPYLYTLFYESACAGSPIMRPLIYEFQADKAAQSNDFDFMFGPWLLVANVVEPGARTRAVMLPQGHWYGWECSDPFIGGRQVTLDTPLERIPLFIREGAIIPMAEPVSPIKLASLDRLELLIACGGRSEYEIYLDDGISNDYLKQEYTLLHVEQDGKSISVSQHGTYTAALNHLSLRLIIPEGIPSRISMDGKPLKRVFDRRDIHADTTWFFDYDKRRVEVEMTYTQQTRRLDIIHPKHRDMTPLSI